MDVRYCRGAELNMSLSRGFKCVVVALASGLANALFRRLPWYKALFNCGNYVLAAGLAATAFHASELRSGW